MTSLCSAAQINVAASAVVVNSTDGLCSLREALANANANSVVYSDCTGGTGADTLNLATQSVYEFTDATTPGSENALPLVTGTLTILGNGSTFRRSNAVATPPFRFLASSGASIELRNLIFENGLFNSTFPGATQSGGGAIRVVGGALDIYFSDFAGNVIDIGRGGAILARQTAVTVRDSRFLDNSALVISAADGGGGMAVTDGTLLIERSAFVGNNADGVPGSSGSGGIGGALLLEVTFQSPAPFEFMPTITHSTISNNTANSSGAVALVAESGPNADILLVLDYVTLVRNDSMVLSDGIGLRGNGQSAFAVYSNSVIHSNGSLLPDGTSIGTDCQVNVYNAFISSFRNLLDQDGSCPADSIDDMVTPRLAPDLDVSLTDDFHQPVAGGALINAGGGSCMPGVTLDQRRNVRANGPGSGGPACDIGAIELYNENDVIFADGFEAA